MPDSPLTLDAALALLDGYEDDDAPVTVLSCEPKSPLSKETSLRSQPLAVSADRFKRARERKKNELAQLRLQARGLEEALRRLQLQRQNATSPELLVWREAAMQQLRERTEAELVNAQLRRMVDATLEHTRRLKAMLAYPEGLVQYKRLQSAMTTIASVVELHGLLIALDLLEIQAHETFSRFPRCPDKPVVETGRGAGSCHLLVEAYNANIVPFDVAAVSESVWRHLAFENDEVADARATVTRSCGMDIVNGNFSLSYVGTMIFRKQTPGDGRVVVLWASDWEPVGLTDWSDHSHESFRREGIVCVSPSPTHPNRFSYVQSFYRIERDGCGDPTCARGACGDATAGKAEDAIAACVECEMHRMMQAIADDLMEPSVGDSMMWGSAPAVLNELTVTRRQRPAATATRYTVFLRVHSADQFKYSMSPSSYCKIYIGETAIDTGTAFSSLLGGNKAPQDHQTFRTNVSTSEHKASAYWNETFEIPVHSTRPQMLSLRVMNFYQLFSPTIGACTIPLQRLPVDTTIDEAFALYKGRTSAGTIRLQLVIRDTQQQEHTDEHSALRRQDELVEREMEQRRRDEQGRDRRQCKAMERRADDDHARRHVPTIGLENRVSLPELKRDHADSANRRHSMASLREQIDRVVHDALPSNSDSDSVELDTDDEHEFVYRMAKLKPQMIERKKRRMSMPERLYVPQAQPQASVSKQRKSDSASKNSNAKRLNNVQKSRSWWTGDDGGGSDDSDDSSSDDEASKKKKKKKNKSVGNAIAKTVFKAVLFGDAS